jgi:hypothetical protein
MSVTNKFAIPTIVVLATLLLIVTTAIWQFGAPVHAAGLFQSQSDSAVHGLKATPLTAPLTSLSLSAGDACASTCSTAALPTAVAPSGVIAPQ